MMERKGLPPKPMLWNLYDVEEARKFIAHAVIVKPGPEESKITHIVNNHKQPIPLDRASDELIFNAVNNMLRGNNVYH